MQCNLTIHDTPSSFYFLDASSGKGKTQLAESINMPVIYIPLTHDQDIYKNFLSVSEAVLRSVRFDLGSIIQEDQNEATNSRDLYTNPRDFDTVGLLVALFKAVYGMDNKNSVLCLSGISGEKDIQYEPMSLATARTDIKALLSDVSPTNPYQVPLFIIDEVPAQTEKNLYACCILLRNFIRCMNCVCLLSGTEAAAMNEIDQISYSSRGAQPREYLRLILTLPPSDWSIFQHDETYQLLLHNLSNDVCQMLIRTRPLFVQFVLDAIKLDGERGLTVKVLETAKSRVVKDKTHFTSETGLYAQMALLHSSFISRTVDGLLAYESNPRKKRKTDMPNIQCELLKAEKQSCVRHHFGEMYVANKNTILNPALPLYLLPESKSSDSKSQLYVTNEGSTEPFRPEVIFAKPFTDELLYLICMRNGVYFNYQRISTSFALFKLEKVRNRKQMHMFCNTEQSSCSGKFMECEVISASIIATHSYVALTGCPLPFFLKSLVAELNINENYKSENEFQFKNMPEYLNAFKIGQLSPSNGSWSADKDSTFRFAQNDEILLSDLKWSANTAQCDGEFPVMADTVVLSGALESKCYAKTCVPTSEFTKTINNHVKKERFLTIMVVTDAPTPSEDNKTFIKAMRDINVIKITGNLSELNNNIATELNCEKMNPNANVEQSTVIQIVLESIFKQRNATMRSIYEST